MTLDLVCRYFLLFFFCSMLGWLMEVTCKLFQFHRFINRGFLIGPYCPIYGFGAVLVTLLLSGFSDHPIAVFLLAMLVCGTLEYVTSYVMEKLFHARWWDYSQRKFNLNGRVCANTLIPFGLLGLVMVYFLKPLVFGWFDALSETALYVLSGSLAALLLTDTVISTTVLGRIRKNTSLSEKDDTEAITKSVRETLARDSALVRRTLRAFPYVKLYNGKALEKARAARAKLKADLKQAQLKARADIDAREEELRLAVKERKAMVKAKKEELRAKRKKEA